MSLITPWNFLRFVREVQYKIKVSVFQFIIRNCLKLITDHKKKFEEYKLFKDISVEM